MEATVGVGLPGWPREHCGSLAMWAFAALELGQALDAVSRGASFAAIRAIRQSSMTCASHTLIRMTNLNEVEQPVPLLLL